MPWYRSLIFGIFLPCAAVAGEMAAPDVPLSLDAAVDQALQTAPEVGAHIAGIEAANAQAVRAGRLPDPELVIGIDNLPVTGSDAYSTTADFMTMRKLGLMQAFPRGEKRRLERERAEAEVSQAGTELVKARLMVARQVTEAWIRRATAERSLAELRAIEPEVELQAAAARAAVAAGRSSTAEALASEAAVVQLAKRVLAMQGEVRRATLELARWIGDVANRPLAPMPSLDRLPESADVLLRSADEHASLLAFATRVDVARIDVASARAERRPDWSAEFSFAKRGPDFSDMVSLEFRIGLPLAARHRQEPLIAAKNAELRRLESEREAERRMHQAELAQMLVEWELLGEQLRQFETELLPLARDRVSATIASYRSGQGELRLALDAITELADSLIEHAGLESERGRTWAYLRYLAPHHLNPGRDES